STSGATFVDARAGLRPSLTGGAGGGVPHVGPSPSLAHVTIATGHFRNGVLLAPLTAQLVSDQVLEKRHA
nr:FAD-dependent oxidoreductase [Acidobacteriota bacterium]